MKENIKICTKALIIGSTMTVPGVSGGSMAILLGIYENLIGAVSNIFKEFKKSVIFLLTFSIPALVGIIFFSQLVAKAMVKYPMPSRYFFLGIIAGGIPLIFKLAGVKKLELKYIIYPVIGLLVVLGIAQIPEGAYGGNFTMDFTGVMFLIVAGFLLALALVIPGISISQMLLMLGLYEPLVNAVKERNVIFVLPVILSLAVSTFLISKALKKLMEIRTKETYLTVFGFLGGSIIQLAPGVPVGMQTVPCFILLLIGFTAMYTLSRLTN